MAATLVLPSLLVLTYTELGCMPIFMCFLQCQSQGGLATLHFLACRRPTFSETKRVLYSLLSVFEPSSHALQALNAPAKPAAPKPPKHSPQKAAAVAVEPEPQPKVPGFAYSPYAAACIEARV